MKILKAFILFTIIIYNGCSNSTEPDTSVIQSLSVGNYWVYHVTLRRLSDNLIIQESTDTVFVTRQEVFDGETWYQLSAPYFVTNRIDGLWRRADGKSEPQLQIPYPTITGDRYLLQSIDTVKLHIVTESVNRMVKVEAGNFSTYVYKYEYGEVANDKQNCDCSHEEYYSPGIGLVKYKETREKSESIIELVKFGKR